MQSLYDRATTYLSQMKQKGAFVSLLKSGKPLMVRDTYAQYLLARVVRKIESLRETPRPAGCKKLKGYKDQWRVRIGNWRVVYLIDNAARLVSFTHIAHRREVYE
jgi:mRNA-degrading endonuclease RelE of RelBE toxin-antitoxin system